MTTTFATDANNDLFLGVSGNIVVVSGLLAVEDACATATKAQLGEMVLSTELGMPNFQLIWVGTPNVALYETFLRNILEGIPGVMQVTGLTTIVQDNTLSYVANITTQFGETTING